MALSIRPAARRDLPAIVRLWREMWDLHVPLDDRFAPGPEADLVMRDYVDGHLDSDRSRVMVAEEEGRVLGYALGTILVNPAVVVHPEFGYVSDVAVTASTRRRGIGSRLLEALHDWFRAKGLRSAEVQVSVRNREARAFWRRKGYTDFLERLHCRL